MAGNVTTPVIGPVASPEEFVGTRVRMPRLARHFITLEDGHQVGVSISGRGVPLVAVHGFTAEGILYAQTLSRLVGLGFKVVAIDTAGHGGTLGLPTDAANLTSYSELLGRTLDHLGVKRSVLMGHSMGGRLITELAANQPERAIAVISLDGVIGDVWDRRVNIGRFFPPLFAGLAVVLVLDTLSTLPLLRDPVQARKLGRLVAPTLIGHVRRPWRMVAPAISVIRSRGSGWMLDKLGQERIPVFAVTGEHDLVVPPSTAHSAAQRSRGEVIIVHGGSHSWLLKDPESLPAIMLSLMKGRLGTAVLRAKMAGGVDPHDASMDDIESVFYTPESLALQLTPPADGGVDLEEHHRRPRYRFTVRAA